METLRLTPNEIAMITKLLNQKLFEGIKDTLHSRNERFVKEDGIIDLNNKYFSNQEKTRIVVEGQSGLISLSELCAKEGISEYIFQQWTNEFIQGKFYLSSESGNTSLEEKDVSIDKQKEIVLEVKSGQTSVAEICRRENISHQTFLKWSEGLNSELNRISKVRSLKSSIYYRNRKFVKDCSNIRVFDYLNNYVNFSSEGLFIISESKDVKLDEIKADTILGFQKINNIRYINKYFEKINASLETGDVFIGCMETLSARRNRLKINRIPIVNSLFFSFEFLIKRILPKVSFTKKYYFDITKGNDRLLSKAEGLGRLVSCGFSIMDYKSIDGLLYFVVKKVSEPSFDLSPSYGPFYKMPRLGKNGKTIGVYKFRTMHPYSEYLQDYIIKTNGYADSGKPAGDFRIPIWGKIMRKYWLDELPQLINVLKGEIKLVGIRPVSKRYFQDIPKAMQKLRIGQKPGCIPPYVSLNFSGDVMSVLQAEKKYLEDKIENPYFTDIKYFFSALYNIIFRHKRSA